MTSALNNEEAAASSPLWAAPLASAGPAGCGTREQSWSSREHFDRELCKNKQTRNRSSVSRSQQSTETTHLLHLNTDTCCVFFLFNKSLQPHFSRSDTVHRFYVQLKWVVLVQTGLVWQQGAPSALGADKVTKIDALNTLFLNCGMHLDLKSMRKKTNEAS